MTPERKLLLSLVDLGIYDLPKANSLLDKFTFDYDSDFSSVIDRIGFKSVVALVRSGGIPTLDSIASESIRQGCSVVDSEQLKKICENHSAYSLGFEGYARDTIESGDKRKLLKSLTDAIHNINNPKISANDIFKRLTKDKFRSRESRPFKKLSTVTEGIVDQLKQGKPPTKIVKTGIKELDDVIGGWQPTLNLIGAEPGVGKSALLAATVDAISKNHKIAFFSLEDESSWLSYRIISSESGVNQFDMRFKKLDPSDIDKVVQSNTSTKLYQDNVFMVDGSDRKMSDDEIVSTANDLFHNHGIEIIFIDHLGELSCKSIERPDIEISNQLSNLRRIANRLNIPVVVAAHFRRPANGGRITEPVLTDFANSSGSERKARVALGLTREPGSDVMTIHILKQTNGPSGNKVSVKFDHAAATIINTEGGYK